MYQFLLYQTWPYNDHYEFEVLYATAALCICHCRVTDLETRASTLVIRNPRFYQAPSLFTVHEQCAFFRDTSHALLRVQP